MGTGSIDLPCDGARIRGMRHAVRLLVSEEEFLARPVSNQKGLTLDLGKLFAAE